MKETTRSWLQAAEEDLLAAKLLAKEMRLTNIAAFHCQQCLEKSFKAIIEEKGQAIIKSHDLLRLHASTNIQLADEEHSLLGIINEVYIDARYPGNLGLLPAGKPTVDNINSFIELCEHIFSLSRSNLK